MTTPEPGSGNTRRAILKKAAALGLGTGALVVTGQLVTATPAHAAIQAGWEKCRRCKCLVWRPGGVSGTNYCAHPSWLVHEAAAGHTYTMYFTPTAQAGQDGWAYCRWCEGMFFWHDVGEPYAGVCPNGGRHNGYDSHNYLMPTAPRRGHESGWRYCSRCRMMFGEPDNYCPAGGEHNGAGSFNYYLYAG
jgi:hypothetical protein